MKALVLTLAVLVLSANASAGYSGRPEDLVPGTLVAKDLHACAIYAANFMLDGVTKTVGLKSPEQLNATRDGIGIMCLVKPPGEVDVDTKNMFEDVTYAAAIKTFGKSDPNVVAFAKQHHLTESQVTKVKASSPAVH